MLAQPGQAHYKLQRHSFPATNHTRNQQRFQSH